MLGNVEQLPDEGEIRKFITDNPEVAKNIEQKNIEQLDKTAKQLLAENKVLDAWKVLLAQQ